MFTARLLLAVGLLLQLVAEPVSHAYKLEPISRVFSPSGSNATQSFEVINNVNERVALTVSIATLQRDDAYVETNKPADDDFLVYPPQLIVAPGKRQTIRVTWLGDTKLTREKAYRIIVKQVPIHLVERTAPISTREGDVKVMLTYRGTLFIRPAGAKPQIETEVAALEPGKHLALYLVNRGTATGTVKRCSLALQLPSGERISLAPSVLAGLVNQRVLAGTRRRYDIAWPPGLRGAQVKAVGQCAVNS
jgi:fimbrial chaperone protein